MFHFSKVNQYGDAELFISGKMLALKAGHCKFKTQHSKIDPSPNN